jgi:aspartate/methionine/tyrosine aminotransferase
MERLVLTASTSEAYAFVIKLLCDPGDAVLAPRPSYPLLDELVRLEGATIEPYRLAWDGDWHVDRATVRPSDRARAVIAVSPNNPTGSLLARDEVAHLAGFGVPVIVDEVFLGYPLETAPGAASAFSFDHDVFVLGGLSKLAGLPQMKLGWIAVGGSDAFAGEALAGLERVADAYLSLGTPAQVAAAEWLDASAVTRDAIRARTRANLEHLRAALASTPLVSVPRVDAGWYACMRFPRTLDDERWALRALERGVMVQPGYFYDFDEDGWLVVSLLAEEDAFREGIARVLAMAEGD